MGLFGKKKTDLPAQAGDKKKVDAKPAPVKAVKKDLPAQAGEAKPKVKPAGKKESMKDLYGSGVKKTGTTVTKEGKKEKAVRKYGDAYKILVKPLITEKAANLGSQDKYMFMVADEANKIEIKKAVSEVYGIEPISVNIIKHRGKKVRYGRLMGSRKNWKKAIITLPKGKTINIYEGV